MIKADVTYRAHLRKIKHHVPLFNRSFYFFLYLYSYMQLHKSLWDSLYYIYRDSLLQI